MFVLSSMDVIDEIKKFDGLIDYDTARLIVMYKNGDTLTKISDANGDVGLYAKILSLGKVRKVKGNIVRNAIIGDESGCCLLAIWGEAIDRAIWIKEGDSIKIINGYVRNGYYGKEINVGRNGDIKKVGKEIKVGKCKNFLNFSGKLIKKYPTQVYINDDGEKFFSKILIDEKEIILFDERIKDIQKIKNGSMVSIKWAYEKNKKIYLNDFGRCIVK